MRCMVGYKTAITVNYWFQEILFLFLKDIFLFFKERTIFSKLFFLLLLYSLKKLKIDFTSPPILPEVLTERF